MPTIYDIWGWNTAEDRPYFCKTFYSYTEAVKRVKELETEAARTQPKNLRNTFAIQMFTEEEQERGEHSKAKPADDDIVEESFPTEIDEKLTAAIYCRYCGEKNPINARYCLSDGSMLRTSKPRYCKTINPRNTMVTIYKVWGWDTFAHESYSCGEFYTYDDALRQLQKLATEAERTQDEELRDTFSIQTLTEAELREQGEFLQHQLEEQKYDRQALHRYIQELLLNFIREIATFDISTIKEDFADLVIVGIDKFDTKNCFSKIQLILQASRIEESHLHVRIALFFPTTKYNDGGEYSSLLLFDTLDNLQKKLLEEDTLDKAYERAVELADRFYDDEELIPEIKQ